MDYKSLYENKNFGQILFGEELKNYTNFGIGGLADALALPGTVDELEALLKFNYENKIETSVIGKGTNLLVSDNGIRGCVIALADNFDDVKIEDDCLIALSGTALIKASRAAIEIGLAGMEEISGIPGSVGGAIAMNAGAYGGEIKDIVVEVKAFDYEGNLHTFNNDDMHFSYRHSRVFEDNLIVVSAKFKLKPDDKRLVIDRFKDYRDRRTSKQPLDKKSAGSTFKRPEGSYASKLIDECGLRGFREGDCQVSEKHCGFIINAGEATCTEMLAFINHVAAIVKEKTGFTLEREVKLVGEL
ncbi:UDP-N-acetylmuramate dehydrogenase [Anaerococcus sp. NML200537]|uniref:UDP-N-acetylmuramate dehydrogenase n=1 Tax=Anaerococcus sp. NML200537 TaxID=2954485 RepID=UPI0022378973|nr:UDP-N-acetylmuramate dehydrogenase [Anaerococcus sp. NML200537]MCW6701290.1 UDP-N-acetylmuramate dehydrogenase [Anaerococcus sp. NML200537]